MFVRTSTLRAIMRANERREEALLGLIRELGDRLAHAHTGQPWNLPPRPMKPPTADEEVAVILERETIAL